MLCLTLTLILVTACLNGFFPRIHITVILGCNVVADSINNHVGHYLRKVRKESHIVIMIGSDIKGILFVSAVSMGQITE